MIISRTPVRISFFGGGPDYPAWYRDHGGMALGATIDKCCYLTCRCLSPFFKHRKDGISRPMGLSFPLPAHRTILRFTGQVDMRPEINYCSSTKGGMDDVAAEGPL